MLKMGYCGDVCDYCPRYIATRSGSEEQLREVAALWHRAGARSEERPPEEMICHGCCPEKACPYGITECAREKGVANCGECEDYPCERLSRPFERLKTGPERWRKACSSEEEYERIRKAFHQKKENLARAHREYLCRKEATSPSHCTRPRSWRFLADEF